MKSEAMPLLDWVEATAREHLETSIFGQLAPDEKVADLFCGGGGWGVGARKLGIHVDYAVNHDPIAIDTHARNYPECKAHQGDAWRTRPRDVVGDAQLGLLLASAACTTHSRARGAAPISKRVHMLGWCIARWMEDVAPRIVLVENVPEWLDWGPMIQVAVGEHWRWNVVRRKDREVVGTMTGPCYHTEDGRAFAREHRGRETCVKPVMIADPSRKGQYFRRWWRCCERLGYKMERRVLNAPDYGSASRRKRLFIIARRDGAPICWPEKTHAPKEVGSTAGVRRRTETVLGTTGTHVAECEPGDAVCGGGEASDRGSPGGGDGRPERRARSPYRTAAEIIDWSHLGKSIFDRKQPLKPKTLKRTAHGIGRNVFQRADPFVLRVTHGDGFGWKVTDIHDAMPTQTTRHDLAVVTPCLGGAGGCDHGEAPVDKSLHAVLTREDTTLVVPVLQQQNTGVSGQTPGTPGPTVVTGGQHSLITPVVPLIRGDAMGHAIDGVLPGITAGNGPGRGAGAGHALGIIAPIIAGSGGSEYAGQPVRVDQPLGTIKRDDSRAVISAVMVPTRNSEREGQAPRAGGVDEPGPTVCGANGHAVVSAVVVRTDMHKSNAACVYSAQEPVRTITTGGGHGVAVPVMTQFRHGGGQTQAVDASLPGITAGGNHSALIAPVATDYYGASSHAKPVDAALGTLTTLERHGVASCVLSTEAGLRRAKQVAEFLVEHLGKVGEKIKVRKGERWVEVDGIVPIEEGTGLAYIELGGVGGVGGVRRYFVDILFRMLQPAEIAAAMGFPADFSWPKTKRDTVRLIGNAVECNQAAALIGAVLPRGRGMAERGEAAA